MPGVFISNSFSTGVRKLEIVFHRDRQTMIMRLQVVVAFTEDYEMCAGTFKQLRECATYMERCSWDGASPSN
jgi:hypothetical protein